MLLLLRYKAVYDDGMAWFGTVLLMVFFAVQWVIHQGAAGDFFVFYVPGFVGFWDAARLLCAVGALIIAWRILETLFRKHPAGMIEALKPVVLWNLGRTIQSRRPGWYKRFLSGIKGVFWGIGLAFFHGMWPLPRDVVYLIYNQAFGTARNFFLKIGLFELIIIAPFLAVFIFVSRAARSEIWRARLSGSRFLFLVLSGICAGSGISMMMYYFLMGI